MILLLSIIVAVIIIINYEDRSSGAMKAHVLLNHLKT